MRSLWSVHFHETRFFCRNHQASRCSQIIPSKTLFFYGLYPTFRVRKYFNSENFRLCLSTYYIHNINLTFMKSTLLMICMAMACMLSPCELQAQERTVSGAVTSAEDGLPLP